MPTRSAVRGCLRRRRDVRDRVRSARTRSRRRGGSATAPCQAECSQRTALPWSTRCQVRRGSGGRAARRRLVSRAGDPREPRVARKGRVEMPAARDAKGERREVSVGGEGRGLRLGHDDCVSLFEPQTLTVDIERGDTLDHKHECVVGFRGERVSVPGSICSRSSERSDPSIGPRSWMLCTSDELDVGARARAECDLRAGQGAGVGHVALAWVASRSKVSAEARGTAAPTSDSMRVTPNPVTSCSRFTVAVARGSGFAPNVTRAGLSVKSALQVPETA